MVRPRAQEGVGEAWRDRPTYSRTCPSKSGLAAMIGAVKAIKACGIELRGRIGLVIVPDEETGGWGGSRYLDEVGLLGQRGIGMLTPEPTADVVWNANRGAISLRITVKGKPAHVGLHYQGVNAFARMLTVAEALAGLEREVAERRTRFNITPEAARAKRARGGTRARPTASPTRPSLRRRSRCPTSAPWSSTPNG
ncbi:MAG TPA: M20/M25/M40 family metallo-hydrolase [Candidatus Binatia bacterium]|nr:M20/M25/M40 family metallo-hydrolase [Candidatus Binatia bacterium]